MRIVLIRKNHEAAFFFQRMQKKPRTTPQLSHPLNTGVFDCFEFDPSSFQLTGFHMVVLSKCVVGFV